MGSIYDGSWGKPYTYPILTPSKGKEMAKLEKEMYLFNISKLIKFYIALLKTNRLNF